MPATTSVTAPVGSTRVWICTALVFRRRDGGLVFDSRRRQHYLALVAVRQQDPSQKVLAVELFKHKSRLRRRYIRRRRDGQLDDTRATVGARDRKNGRIVPECLHEIVAGRQLRSA